MQSRNLFERSAPPNIFLRNLRNIKHIHQFRARLLSNFDLENYSLLVDIKCCRQEHWTTTEINLFVNFTLQFTTAMLSSKFNLSHLRKISAGKHNGSANSEIGNQRTSQVEYGIDCMFLSCHVQVSE